MRKITVFILVLALLLIFPVSAKLTGQARGQAVINVDVDEGSTEVISRTVWVKNVNDIPVNVAIIAIDDIEDRTEIEEPSFILQPGQEKTVKYLLKISQPGNYYGKLNIGFSPADGSKENGVGISLAITVIADGEGEEFVSPEPNTEEIPEDTEETPEDTTDIPQEEDTTDGEGVDVFGGGQNPVTPKTNINWPLIIFIGLLLIVIAAGVFAFLRGGKK
ncbi:MAG: hypothetical protein PHE43_01070 [Candidatus Nanoarchaeia archaeon]|nr:hypothetical protein [Candidatus Nanoarchaeia archaeon]